MYRKNIKEQLQAALSDTPVVLLNGARQTGKTTLAESLAREIDGRYLTLECSMTATPPSRSAIAMMPCR